MSEPILEVNQLSKQFEVKHGWFGHKRYVKAVNQVSFKVHKGETFGLVGESGCGKSSLGRTLIRIYEPDEGQIVFEGQDISHLSNKQLLPLRKKIQMIFQDPYASLNPRLTVGEIIREPMDIHQLYEPSEREAKVCELLELVGLKPDHIRRYPHEFSGGQRQRIGIARTLALNPEFIICDEPISALDVSIQAQIINLLEELQEKLGISYLFIAHDLSMVKHISHRIGVMYLGYMVEIGDSQELYENPLHPYTKVLLSSVPVPDPILAKAQAEEVLADELPSPLDLPVGCPFQTRCKHVTEKCKQEMPELKEVKGRLVACHLVHED